MQLSKIVIGGMRFKDRESGIATIRAAIDAGFNYIDTSACYCRESEDECSEAWVGAAVNHPDYRNRVLVSTKCTPGNGGRELNDEFQPEGGFGARSVAQLNQIFDQSLKRLNLNRVDYYHLWTTHTKEQFDEAMKPGGWYEGVMGRRDQWDHLGVTTHGDPDTIIYFLESGKFETLTIPLNVINTTRMKVVDYCREKDIKVIAMNPLAGGLLAAREDVKELALRYLMSLDNVHLLIGFSSVEEVAYAKWIEDTNAEYGKSTQEIQDAVAALMDTEEERCTACGYCEPCPEAITVGAALSYYNAYKYLGIESARKEFNDKQWEQGLQLKNCKACGICESRCPNGLPVQDIIRKACELMYSD